MTGFLSFLHIALLGALFQQGCHWKEFLVPLVLRLYPQQRLESILYYVQQSVGNKGKKPVTSGHKGWSDLPKTTSLDGIPIPSWM